MCSLTEEKGQLKRAIKFYIENEQFKDNLQFWKFLIYKEFFKYGSLCFDGQDYSFFFKYLSHVKLSFSKKRNEKPRKNELFPFTF